MNENHDEKGLFASGPSGSHDRMDATTNKAHEEFLYHATNSKNLESIRGAGLMNTEHRRWGLSMGLHFADNEARALRHGDAIMRIRKGDLPPVKPNSPNYYSGGGDHVYFQNQHGSVHPSKLEIKTPSGWRKL